MKKFLSILAAVGLTATVSSTVVACSNYTKVKHQEKGPIDSLKSIHVLTKSEIESAKLTTVYSSDAYKEWMKDNKRDFINELWYVEFDFNVSKNYKFDGVKRFDTSKDSIKYNKDANEVDYDPVFNLQYYINDNNLGGGGDADGTVFPPIIFKQERKAQPMNLVWLDDNSNDLSNVRLEYDKDVIKAYAESNYNLNENALEKATWKIGTENDVIADKNLQFKNVGFDINDKNFPAKLPDADIARYKD